MADTPQRHPNLNLTPEEKRVFFQLFQIADTTNLGVITGETAVPFFEKTHLPSGTLGEIWQLADRENRGLLTPSGFGIVLRLIGHAQAGRVPSEELALQPGPLPRFEGVSVDVNAPVPDSRAISPPPTAAATASSIRVPPLQHDDAVKFASLFDKSDVTNGMISGEGAKQIFERARLPNEILGRIWNLSDTKQRGALDATEFVIAMHLLTSFKSGALRSIPQTLPPGLYEAASRRGPVAAPAAPVRSSYTRPDVPPIPSIPSQFTGPQRTASPMSPIGRTFTGQLSAQTTGAEWLITPQEKAHFDTIFETVDAAKAGVITGDQAVAFFIKAQLPEEVLAQIWDLADIDADGQLTREEFAVAMYLVRLQRGGKEPLPQVLPPALIPPNMRRQAPVPAAPIAAPTPPPVPLPRSAADDLFGLDTPAPPPAQPQFPQSTGGSNPAFNMPASPTRSSPLANSTTFKPFIPTSSFGQTLHPQMTGASSGTPVSIRSPAPAPAADDLLGDSDPVESSKLTQETTELANLSNQIGSLATEMHNVQEKRTTAEQDISQTSQQKRDFESRLAQARAMYEQEVANYKALEERLKSSKAETVKLQQEYALIEGSRQDLQTQYTQVSTALASDQQENASLKEKIRYANAEVAQLKPALEKARSDARQHKGLVAINKKQLATVEGERDKMQGEIDSLAQEAQQHAAESARAISPAPEVVSPAASNSSNTNPFFRRAATSSSERAVSPEAPTDQQKTFDSLFGQSFMAPALGVAPPTSFRADSPQSFAKSPISSNIPSPSISPAPVNLPGSFPTGDPPTPIPSHLTPGFSFNENQSVTSSTVVSPPGSRFGGPEGTVNDFGTPSADSSDYNNNIPTPGAEGAVVRSPFDEFSPNVIPAAEVVASEAPAPALSPMVTGNEETAKDLSFDELFGSKAHKRSESENANDFEEAFASMKPQHSGFASDSAHASTSEFPPIQELHPADEEDESSDDESVQVFDDNFEPVVPKKEEAIDAAQLAAFPTPGSSLPQPPPADAQQSPPTYEPGSGDSSLPAEFNGLLPERSDPTVAPDAPHSVEASTGAPIVGGVPQHDEAFNNDSAGAFGEVKTGGTDFDAAFAGLDLAPAKEVEDDEDEAEEVINKDTTEFDFSFDNPQTNHTTASKTDDKAGSSEFFNFDSNAHAGASEASPAPNGEAANHDWDALFAPLDNSKTAPEGNANGSDPKSPGWALSTDTGEDDLILQRLTGMGYPRDESLAALEKFDYNLDKAADYLTSK